MANGTAYSAAFSYDIFVSYAHFDNEPDTRRVRWIYEFRDHLKGELRKRLGAEVSVFLDAEHLKTNTLDYLLESARNSAIFIPVFSPSYVNREWTKEELKAFDQAAQVQNGPGSRRIVPVEILPVAGDQLMPLIETRRLVRRPFYDNDKVTGAAYTLTSQNEPQEYANRLADLVSNLTELIREQGKNAQPAAPAPVTAPSAETSGIAGKTVLLAQDTDDLYTEHQTVLAYLKQFGVRVLPEADYPQGGPDFVKAVKADLEQADLFVQLLSDRPSRKPPDLREEGDVAKSYSAFQYGAAKRMLKPVLLWRRPDLDIQKVGHHDRPLLDSADVQAMGLQEFLREIKNALTPPKRPRAERAAGYLFIVAERSDQDLALALRDAFKRAGLRSAISEFKGSAAEIAEDLEQNMVSCEYLFLIHRKAPARWVRCNWVNYVKSSVKREKPPNLTVILVAPPAESDPGLDFDLLTCEDGRVETIVERAVELVSGLGR